MTKPLDKFQWLLSKLFQFDCADLDFGIYRIMNYKRGVIEKFITRDLPKAVAEDRAEGLFQIMCVIKAVGSRIIDFLAQVENFQKMPWKKRKFVTETQYCITLGNIDESFYPEIAACEPQ